MKTIIPKPLRCAIYTRRSTEHNLDLAFNTSMRNARPARPMCLPGEPRRPKPPSTRRRAIGRWGYLACVARPSWHEGNIREEPSLPSAAKIQGVFMDQSEEVAARPLSRVAVGVIAAFAGSLTLVWLAFLVWLVLKALSLM